MHPRMAMCVEKAVAQPFSHCWSLDFNKDMIEDASIEDVGSMEFYFETLDCSHSSLVWVISFCLQLTGRLFSNASKHFAKNG